MFHARVERNCTIAVWMVIVLLAGLTAARADQPPPEAPITWKTPELQQALDAYDDSPGHKEFNAVLEQLPRVYVGKNSDREVFIVEGDSRRSRVGVCDWLQQLTKKPGPTGAIGRNGESCPPYVVAKVSDEPEDRSELRTIECDGKPCIWGRGFRNITYAIDLGQLPNKDRPREGAFVTLIAAAAKQWSTACDESAVKPVQQCGLKIGEVASIDDAFFVVRYNHKLNEKPINKTLIAHAFFPNDPIEDRVLEVGPRFWTKSDDNWRHTLTHELGHILGYAHEQLAIGSPCNPAGEETVVDTRKGYDRESIMHSTRCKSATGLLSIKLSDQDKLKHAEYYGAK
jgi:hypothetical protein